MFPKYFNIALILIAGLVLCSCSGLDRTTTAPEITLIKNSENVCLGTFTVTPGENLDSAVIQRVRSAQFDVTQWADINIQAVLWDPDMRTWTLTVQVSNPTHFTGYGVQAIFTELGGKELRWPDGFVWMNTDIDPEDERCSFFAIEKDTPGREFPGLHSNTHDYVFYFPEGVDKWIPISFIIDAHLGGPRPEPMVEDMGMGYFAPPCYHSAVTAKVADHQSPTGDLSVWVDLSAIGGSSSEPMFDDGLNDDGDAGDGIFGAKFTGGNLGELYTLTIYARDPEQNMAENDVRYSPIEYSPLPPITFESFMQGPYCLFIDERLQVIEDETEWYSFWNEFAPWDMPIPVIDFLTYNVVAVCIGQRGNDCYSVNIDNIDYYSENCGVGVFYTETVPTPDCACKEIITSPFHLVLESKTYFDTAFVGGTFEDCPENPCLDLVEVASGTHGASVVKNTSVIMDQAAWESWWASSVGASEPPYIDFDTEMVIGVTQGEFPTSGYYPTVDSACWDDTMELEITVGWHIPGPTCNVMMVFTNPYAAYKTEKTMLPHYFTTYDDVYSCD